MIQARMDLSCIVVDTLPTIGEMISVKGFGQVKVLEISETITGSFIKLQFQESTIGEFTQTFPLIIEGFIRVAG